MKLIYILLLFSVYFSIGEGLQKCEAPGCQTNSERYWLWPHQNPQNYYKCVQGVNGKWQPALFNCYHDLLFDYAYQKCVPDNQWRDICVYRKCPRPNCNNATILMNDEDPHYYFKCEDVVLKQVIPVRHSCLSNTVFSYKKQRCVNPSTWTYECGRRLNDTITTTLAPTTSTTVVTLTSRPESSAQTTTTVEITTQDETTPELQTTPTVEITTQDETTPEPQTTPTVEITTQDETTPTMEITTRDETTPEAQTTPTVEITTQDETTLTVAITTQTETTPEPQTTPTVEITTQAENTSEPQTTPTVEITTQDETTSEITTESVTTPESETTTVTIPVSTITPKPTSTQTPKSTTTQQPTTTSRPKPDCKAPKCKTEYERKTLHPHTNPNKYYKCVKDDGHYKAKVKYCNNLTWFSYKDQKCVMYINWEKAC